MPDLLSLLPLRSETPTTVRARMDADANAGLDPSDPRFVDTTVGGAYYDLTQRFVTEAVKLWDMVTVESVAAAIPLFAWGDYLDYHGASVRLPRKDAVQATGAVLFGGTAGQLIPAGTQVSTQAPDTGTDPIIFETIQSRTLAATPGPTNLTLTGSASGGTLAAGTYFYVVTALTPAGETVGTVEESVTVSGATSSVTLNWTGVPGATAYKVYRSTVTGDERILATLGAVLTYVDTGAVTVGATQPPTNLIDVRTVEPGASGNVPAGSIDLLRSPVPNVSSVTNPQPMTGGADVETDDLYRDRIVSKVTQPAGAGNIVYYVQIATAFPPIGFCTVQPLWAGAGTVRLVVTDQSNNPVSTTVVQGLQALVDPVSGQGHGLAPIGAIVTVSTPTLVNITVAGVVSFEVGYSYDGANGTTPIRGEIEEALAAYVDALAPQQNVLYHRVLAQFFEVAGVRDVGSLTVNGGTADVTVGSLQVARLLRPVSLS